MMYAKSSITEIAVFGKGLPLGPSNPMAFDPLAWLNEDEEECGEPEVDGHTHDLELQLAWYPSQYGSDSSIPMKNDENSEKKDLKSRRISMVDRPAGIDTMPESGSPAGDVNDEAVVILGGRLNIRDAEGLQRELVVQLTNKACVRLECSGIESADTAALQLLTAFYREACRRGVNVHWHEPGDALSRSAELVGLAEEMELSPKREEQ